jgi:imidazolonepropionase-like amidohydrolase
VRQKGLSLGLPKAMVDKMHELGSRAAESLERLRQVNAKIGFGTDLLGPLISQQSIEFRLRREVCSALEILRSATSVNAELLQMEGRLGTIAPDAFADVLVIDGNPLDDITVLEDANNICLIVRDGKVCKNSIC